MVEWDLLETYLMRDLLTFFFCPGEQRFQF